VLGAEDVNMLRSKHQLAVALYCQAKDEEIEQLLRQVVQQREKVLGGHHKDTLASKELFFNTACAGPGLTGPKDVHATCAHVM
jgi:hypothetical protein